MFIFLHVVLPPIHRSIHDDYYCYQGRVLERLLEVFNYNKLSMSFIDKNLIILLNIILENDIYFIFIWY